MKPRTKLQHRITNLSKSLPELSAVQKEWALKNCLKHVGYRTKKHISCLDCGHIWPGPRESKSCVCPSCNTKITIRDTLKRKLDQRVCMSILDVCEEFQVVRIIEIFSYHKSGVKRRFLIDEVMHQFFNPDTEMLVVGCLLTNMGNFQGQLEVRSTKGWYGNKYDIWVDKMYPKFNCLPIYKRHGLTTRVDGISHYQLLRNIISDNISETLLKAKQYGLLGARTSSKKWEVSKHWNSIKICIRQKYIVKMEEAIIWMDYLDLLQYYKKDLRSPKYLCPTNLKAVHDKMALKKQAEMKHSQNWRDYQRLTEFFNDEVDQSIKNKPVSLQLEVNRLSAHRDERLKQQREEDRVKRIQEDQQRYIDSHGMFFGMSFKKGDLNIVVLQSIDDFLKEGEALKHCVFSNKYYNKENSLILSARLNDKPVETIEVTLDNMKVVQARGVGNAHTQYHDDILNLVRKNMKAIADRRKMTKKDAA
jgi:hypothetical protein